MFSRPYIVHVVFGRVRYGGTGGTLEVPSGPPLSAMPDVAETLLTAASLRVPRRLLPRPLLSRSRRRPLLCFGPWLFWWCCCSMTRPVGHLFI